MPTDPNDVVAATDKGKQGLKLGKDGRGMRNVRYIDPGMRNVRYIDPGMRNVRYIDPGM